MAEDWSEGGFALYIHWPFCEAKCPYCDFNSHVVRSIDHDAWRVAYLEELKKAAAETPGRVLRSVFFGGGTPSLMEPRTVGDILNAVHRLWPVANDLEVTLEANPSSVEATRFEAYAGAGINRVSLGVQAFNDEDLRRLGRLHTAEEARTAFDIARKQFDRVSFDLIYARQNQTLAAWEDELTSALDFAVDHLSLYQLTIEQGTAFGDRYNRGALRGLPDDDLSADMYALTQDVCADAGFDRYEVSNHARDGAQSRHNLVYWQYGDYVGVGPGAHGRLTVNGRRHATEHARAPSRWLTGPREVKRETLTPRDEALEFLLMGLRLTDGVSRTRFIHHFGRPPDEDVERDLVQNGLITPDEEHLIVSKQGLAILNAVIEALIPD